VFAGGMHPADLQSELEHDGARELLETAPLARFAYSALDGAPMVIPIGFLWSRGAVVLCTSVGSPKVRALAEYPRVAVTIDRGSTPAESRALLIRGEARVQIVDGIPDEYITAARKVMSDEEVAAFEQQVRQMYPQMARISITPGWARYYDFGGGRLPRSLQRLAEGG
jgi:hypothetical protein